MGEKAGRSLLTGRFAPRSLVEALPAVAPRTGRVPWTARFARGRFDGPKAVIAAGRCAGVSVIPMGCTLWPGPANPPHPRTRDPAASWVATAV